MSGVFQGSSSFC